MTYKYNLGLITALVFAISVLSLAIPYSKARNITTIAIFIAILSFLPFQHPATPHPSFIEDYATATSILAMMEPWVARALIDNSDRDYWRDGESAESITQLTFLQRLKRSWELNVSPRGIGWNFRIKQIPMGPSPGYSKW